MEDLKKELEFIELEERLEMVNLAQAEASSAACQPVQQNSGCSNSGCGKAT